MSASFARAERGHVTLDSHEADPRSTPDRSEIVEYYSQTVLCSDREAIDRNKLIVSCRNCKEAEVADMSLCAHPTRGLVPLTR